ncbi:MAG: mismatch-specific DNA-glycosylase [Stellaceae bacterium]
MSAIAPASDTLPDLLRPGLEIVFVGINPSNFSVAKGHYFARPGNRFWPSFSRSGLSRAARQGLGVDGLRPDHDRALLDYGFGFTDVVKRATPNVKGLEKGELAPGVVALRAKLERARPQVACFQGITGYRPVHRLLMPGADDPGLGPQALRIGATRIFLLPNPSPANAHSNPQQQTEWYDRLALFLMELQLR